MAILQPGEDAYYVRNISANESISPYIHKDVIVETRIVETLDETVSPPEIVIVVKYKVAQWDTVLLDGTYVFGDLKDLLDFLEDNVVVTSP